MLEVCVDTLRGAIIAEASGADRIELCSALELGGVTPSAPFISAVRRSIRLPLMVLIRTRSGDFFFDDAECAIMLQEAQQALELGADGVVVGGLVGSGDLNIGFLKSIAYTLPKCQLTMHRAFDQVRDPKEALESLVHLGFTRILTSGGLELAANGIQQLEQLSDWSRGRIEILPAGGITPLNATEILASGKLTQLHGSFREITLAEERKAMPNPIAIAQTKAALASLKPIG